MPGVGGGEEECIGQAEEIFKGVETILYDTVTVDLWHYTHVQTQKRILQRANPQVHYELQLIIIYQ